jgi:DNA mismatch repair protein MutS
LDFCVSGANCAYQNNYTKPEITKDYNLIIKSARHPVVEQIEDEFIANDLELNKKSFAHIIT